jgi:hypothetical protein
VAEIFDGSGRASPWTATTRRRSKGTSDQRARLSTLRRQRASTRAGCRICSTCSVAGPPSRYWDRISPVQAAGLLNSKKHLASQTLNIWAYIQGDAKKADSAIAVVFIERKT